MPMPIEIAEATETIRGQLRAALTLVNDAAKRSAATRPDLERELKNLAAAFVHAVKLVNTLPVEVRAPISVVTARP